MKKTLFTLGIVIGLWAAEGAPLGTGFTYQGRLDDGSAPANGTYDFNFLMYDAETGGNVVGPIAGVNANGVSVANGVFTVNLDFGDEFNGLARWLVISANTNLARPLVILAPRQPVMPAPYALFATHAGNASMAAVANAVSAGTINNEAIVNATITGAKIANGNVVRSLNGMSDALNLVAGPNITLSPSGGNSLTISASATGGPAWLLSGNGGTGGANFLGTTDNQPLDVRVNNQRAFRLEPTGTAPNVIGGSQSNLVSAGAVGAAIGGGGYGVGGPGPINDRNQVSDNYGTVSGGARNVAGNTNATASDARYATVAGGYSNQAQGEQSTIGGGRGNRALGLNSTVGGGLVNWAQADGSVITGGSENYVGTNIVDGIEFGISTNYAGYSALMGGELNRISSIYATLGGGTLNEIYGDYGSILGGYQNRISARTDFYSSDVLDGTISGGSFNTVQSDAGTIAGGSGNSVSGASGSILGGENNHADGNYSSILGGSGNTALSRYAVVLGGLANEAGTNALFGGEFSLAAGRRAKARHQGSFVWADSLDADVASTNANSVTIRATGGVRIFSYFDENPNGFPPAGVRLAPGAGSWSSLSDRNAKRDFSEISGSQILEKVAAMPIMSWRYRGEAESIRHIGPTAQDFKAAFDVGDSDTSITTVDADGVALAAIQGLNEKLQQKDAEIAELQRGLAELRGLLLKK